MKNLSRTLFMLACFTAITLSVGSCNITPTPDEDDNAALVGTKWYNNDNSLGLEFDELDEVFFYLDRALTGSGVYEYHKSSGIINFEAFNCIGNPGQEIFEGRTCLIQITDAEVTGKDMKVYFHELSETEEYYMQLHKK